MWECEQCRKKHSDKTMAVDVRFGYVDSAEVKKGSDPYDAFNTEEGWGPLCPDCAIAYIKGEEVGSDRV